MKEIMGIVFFSLETSRCMLVFERSLWLGRQSWSIQSGPLVEFLKYAFPAAEFTLLVQVPAT